MGKLTVAVDADKQTLRAGYAQAVTDLEAIRDAPSMTNAQALAAIKKLAGIQLQLLKVLRKTI